MNSESNKNIVAVFDFDGTLTSQDSLPVFLKYVKGVKGFLYSIVKSLPTLALTVAGLASRQQAKEALLTALFRGIPQSQLQRSGETFASGSLNGIIRDDIYQKFLEHRQKNHLCILISANIDIYLVPWANKANFDAVLCSRMAIDSEGNITGKLQGLNCWGPEKVRRLKDFLQTSREDYTLYAYGDSRGDEALLAYADFPFKV